MTVTMYNKNYMHIFISYKASFPSFKTEQNSSRVTPTVYYATDEKMAKSCQKGSNKK